jgi:hypothetical protein
VLVLAAITSGGCYDTGGDDDDDQDAGAGGTAGSCASNCAGQAGKGGGGGLGGSSGRGGSSGAAGDTSGSGGTSGSSGSAGSAGSGPCSEVRTGQLYANDATELAALSNVYRIEGSLQVGGDLSAFDVPLCLEEVTLDLRIGVTGVEDLSAFASLSEVGGVLTVELSNAIQSFTGLSALQRAGGLSLMAFGTGDLSTGFGSLPSLEEVTGDVGLGMLEDGAGLGDVPQLTRIGGTVVFESAGTFPGFAGMPSLTHMGGLHLQGTWLTTLAGLESVTEFGDFGLHLSFVDELDSLTGLDNLVSAGRIHIQDSKLTDLSGLENLTSIGDSGLTLSHSTELVSLSGLEQLETVSGEVSLYDNALLSDLSALSSLREVGGTFHVSSQHGMISLQGPPALTHIGSLRISGNPVLQSVSGFSQVTSIGTRGVTPSLPNSIDYNDVLTSFGGFESLAEVFGDVAIADNAALADITGFAGVVEIEGRLEILRNAALPNLAGLASLELASRGLEIEDNAALASVLGLGNLVQAGIVWIRGNPLLTSLADLASFTTLTTTGDAFGVTDNDSLTTLDGLQGLISLTGSLNVTGNASLVDISALSGVSTISGNINVSENPILPDVDGLEGLTAVAGVVIADNAALTSIAALPAVQITSVLAIRNNPLLPECDAVNYEREVRGLGFNGTIDVTGNQPPPVEGCPLF